MADRLRRCKDHDHPDDPRDRDQKEHQKRQHGSQIPLPLVCLLRLVRHHKLGKTDTHGLLQNRQQQMRHHAGLIDAAPFGGDRVFTVYTQIQILEHKHGCPKHQQFQPVTLEYRNGKGCKQ